jgi:hypothetical protein
MRIVHSTFTPDACATRCQSARSFSSTSAKAVAPAPTRIGAEHDQAFARLGRQGSLDEGAFELADDDPRRTSGRHHARPDDDVGGRPADFRHGRHVGQQR